MVVRQCPAQTSCPTAFWNRTWRYFVLSRHGIELHCSTGGLFLMLGNAKTSGTQNSCDAPSVSRFNLEIHTQRIRTTKKQGQKSHSTSITTKTPDISRMAQALSKRGHQDRETSSQSCSIPPQLPYRLRHPSWA